MALPEALAKMAPVTGPSSALPKVPVHAVTPRLATAGTRTRRARSRHHHGLSVAAPPRTPVHSVVPVIGPVVPIPPQVTAAVPAIMAMMPPVVPPMAGAHVGHGVGSRSQWRGAGRRGDG